MSPSARMRCESAHVAGARGEHCSAEFKVRSKDILVDTPPRDAGRALVHTPYLPTEPPTLRATNEARSRDCGTTEGGRECAPISARESSTTGRAGVCGRQSAKDYPFKADHRPPSDNNNYTDWSQYYFSNHLYAYPECRRQRYTNK